MYCSNIVPGVDVTVKIYRVVGFVWNLYEHIAELGNICYSAVLGRIRRKTQQFTFVLMVENINMVHNSVAYDIRHNIILVK